jgi:hypothetical protein
MTKHKVGLVMVVGALWLSGCGGGGSPTAPSGGETSFLTGTWRGPVTVRREGLPDIIGTAAFTFALVPNTGGTTFRTTVALQHPWFPPSMSLDTAITPAMPGGRIAIAGTYASPRGCEGLLNSAGTATQNRIDADLIGSEGTGCFPALLPGPVTFDGSVVLTKDAR